MGFFFFFFWNFCSQLLHCPTPPHPRDSPWLWASSRQGEICPRSAHTALRGELTLSEEASVLTSKGSTFRLQVLIFPPFMLLASQWLSFSGLRLRGCKQPRSSREEALKCSACRWRPLARVRRGEPGREIGWNISFGLLDPVQCLTIISLCALVLGLFGMGQASIRRFHNDLPCYSPKQMWTRHQRKFMFYHLSPHLSLGGCREKHSKRINQND